MIIFSQIKEGHYSQYMLNCMHAKLFFSRYRRFPNSHCKCGGGCGGGGGWKKTIEIPQFQFIWGPGSPISLRARLSSHCFPVTVVTLWAKMATTTCSNANILTSFCSNRQFSIFGIFKVLGNTTHFAVQLSKNRPYMLSIDSCGYCSTLQIRHDNHVLTIIGSLCAQTKLIMKTKAIVCKPICPRIKV